MGKLKLARSDQLGHDGKRGRRDRCIGLSGLWGLVYSYRGTVRPYSVSARNARLAARAMRPRRRAWEDGAELTSLTVLICSFPLLASFFPAGSSYRTNLASYLSSVYCFGNLVFLGVAQRSVATVSPTRTCILSPPRRLCVAVTCPATADRQTSPIARIQWSLTLLIFLSFIFSFPIIHFILPPLSSSPALLLSLLIAISGALSLSTAYLQSGVFALSALWPQSASSDSGATLAVMSGQGGIAVLVSATQLVIAAVTALNGSGGGQGEEGKPSARAGIVLWMLASVGALGCRLALKHVMAQPGYLDVMAQVGQRQEEGARGEGEKVRTRTVLRKNAKLEVAVAWVFTVTLVSSSKSVCLCEDRAHPE